MTNGPSNLILKGLRSQFHFLLRPVYWSKLEISLEKDLRGMICWTDKKKPGRKINGPTTPDLFATLELR